MYEEHNIPSDAADMGHFHLRAQLTDVTPVSGHKAPTDSILVIDGADRHGYKSAHRRLAKAKGFTQRECTLKAANYDPATGLVSPSVATYWS